MLINIMQTISFFPVQFNAPFPMALNSYRFRYKGGIRMGKLQMKQLADMVGVSTSTISRAFRSPHLVHPKTRERILQVAKETNYIYNAAAGDLSSKTSTVIGVLVPTTKRSLFSDSLLAIQDKTQEKQFSIIIGNTKYDNGIEKELLLQFQGRRVAGMILTGFGFGHEKIVEDLIKNGIPCVVIWEKLDSDTISYVGFDNFKAAYTVTDYLVRLRHRRIGLIIGPYSKMGRTKKRFEGYRAAMEDHGIPFEKSLVIERDLDFIEGKQGMIKLLSLPEPPTAVFAASDTLAIGALAGAKEMGFRVPDDVSLAGFDNIEFAAYCDPPLTTISVPAYQMGQIAVKSLLEMIEKGMTEVYRYCLETDLIIRNSCTELRTRKRSRTLSDMFISGAV